MRWRAAMALLVLLVTAGPGAVAEDCFCLVHGISGAVLRGCEAFKAPTDYHWTAVCTERETGKKSEQTITPEWRRIEAGADRCDPCRPALRDTGPEPPRGDEKPAPATGPRS
ncbi:MAG: hypothetical protein WAS73_02660 [Defluviicoccus sp.]